MNGGGSSQIEAEPRPFSPVYTKTKVLNFSLLLTGSQRGEARISVRWCLFFDLVKSLAAAF